MTSAENTGLQDALALIENLELPYLEALSRSLNEHIAKRRAQSRLAALDEIRRIAGRLGMSVEELMEVKPEKKAKKAELAPRYRDPESGKTWSGVGREPGWIKGKPREQFLIAS